MSAISHTDWTVYCNHPGCHEQVTGSERESRADVRAALRKRGWATGVGDGPRPLREGFCPPHKPGGGS